MPFFQLDSINNCYAVLPMYVLVVMHHPSMCDASVNGTQQLVHSASSLFPAKKVQKVRHS